MNVAPSSQEHEPDGLLRLIKSAGDLVVPSEELRVTTLQRARDFQSDKKWERNFFQFGWGVLILACLLLPVADRLDAWMANVTAPTSVEVEAAALKLSSEQHIDLGTSTSEIYMRMREEQAERFRASREVPSQ